MNIVQVVDSLKAKVAEAGGIVSYEEFATMLPSNGRNEVLQAARDVLAFRVRKENGKLIHTVSID